MPLNEKKDMQLRDVTGWVSCFLFFINPSRAQKASRFDAFVLVSNRH